MNAFPEDRDMQHVGCAAVANLAIGNTANANRLLKAGARVAVQRAMEQFDGVSRGCVREVLLIISVIGTRRCLKRVVEEGFLLGVFQWGFPIGVSVSLGPG